MPSPRQLHVARSRTRSALRVPRLLFAVVAVLTAIALAGCSRQDVEAKVQAEEILEKAGVPVDSVYPNVEPVGGGLDTADGDHLIVMEVAMKTDGDAADAAIVDKTAKTLWTQSIAHIDEILVQGPTDADATTAGKGTRLTSDDLTQRYGPRPAGVEKLSVEVLAEDDARETAALFTAVGLMAFLPLVLVVGGILLVVLIVVIVLANKRRRPRYAAR